MKTIIRKVRENAIIPESKNGNWIDMYASKIIVKSEDEKESVVEEGSINISKGDTVIVRFGVAMKMPHGYEGHVVPRSGTYKKTGMLLTNGVGVIDSNYCGNDDEWMTMWYCTKDSKLTIGERYAQFRIMQIQPSFVFEEVEDLGNENRGGYGSTGK